MTNGGNISVNGSMHSISTVVTIVYRSSNGSSTGLTR